MDIGTDAEHKGLGTPAIRADIIAKLVRDGFVERKKKQLAPTEDGIKLIRALPDSVKSPQLTADWEEVQGFQYQLKLEFPQGKQTSRKNKGSI